MTTEQPRTEAGRAMVEWARRWSSFSFTEADERQLTRMVREIEAEAEAALRATPPVEAGEPEPLELANWCGGGTDVAGCDDENCEGHAATPPADDTLLRKALEAVEAGDRLVAEVVEFLEPTNQYTESREHAVREAVREYVRASEAAPDETALQAEPEARGLDVAAVQAELDAMYPDDDSDVRAHIANIETILGTNRALTVKEAHAMFEATDSARLAATEPTEEPSAGVVAAIMAAGASYDVAMRAAELLAEPTEEQPR